MPIRINFLAEQQVAEEARRRDPFKRAVWAAGGVVLLAVIWGGYLQLKLMGVRSQHLDYDGRYKQIEGRYRTATNNMNQLSRNLQKLDDLACLATNRFLWAPVVQALAESVDTENVRITMLRGVQNFKPVQPPQAGTNAAPSFGRPPVTETIKIELTGRDYLSGGHIGEFRNRVAAQAFFKANGVRTELMNSLPPEDDPYVRGKTSSKFSVDLHFPDRQH